jgi:Mn2+/Fe2+ NRAMP family transporter
VAAGDIGFKFFGIVIWSAAITSVVGCAYTSISFVTSFHQSLANNQRYFITGFILFSAIIFILVGNPVRLLVMAGTVNGITLPVALGIILLASRNKRIVHDYQHPRWLEAVGWMVVVLMGVMSVYSLVKFINS